MFSGGALPLHYAVDGELYGVGHEPSEEVVTALLAAYPEAAKVVSQEMTFPLKEKIAKGRWHGNLPLHIALWSYPNLGVAADGVVMALISAYPEGTKVKDAIMGNLPLHIAVHQEPSVQVVAALIAAYPEGVMVRNDDNQLPLHIAVSENHYGEPYASAEVVAALVATYPRAAALWVKDVDGKTPLELAYDAGDPKVVAALKDFPPISLGGDSPAPPD